MALMLRLAAERMAFWFSLSRESMNFGGSKKSWQSLYSPLGSFSPVFLLFTSLQTFSHFLHLTVPKILMLLPLKTNLSVITSGPTAPMQKKRSSIFECYSFFITIQSKSKKTSAALRKSIPSFAIFFSSLARSHSKNIKH